MVSSSFSVGCTLPVASVTRDTSVCSPGGRAVPGVVEELPANTSPFVDGSIVAACHGPSSTLTSTDLIGVPSFSTTPSTLCWVPSLVTRAMNDFSCMWVMAVSVHFISPLIISPLSVRYQRAWNLPRY